jgi:hypothetical protein
MPAIQPGRLKTSAAELADHLYEPARFIHVFKALLEFYADRTRRPRRSGTPAPLIQAYNVPNQVMRQVAIAVHPAAAQSPAAALLLADELWDLKILEARLLAIELLATIPHEFEAALFSRIQDWSQQEDEPVILEALFLNGAALLRKEKPGPFYAMIEAWLESLDLQTIKLGLLALQYGVQVQDPDPVPVTFKLMTPLLVEPRAELKGPLRILLHELARRTPQETAYFLRQNWLIYENPEIAWLIRQCLPLFSDEIRLNLRELLSR